MYRGRRRLQVSNKLMLGQKVGLGQKGNIKVKLVQEWIETNPAQLFAHVYQYKRYGVKRVRLVKKAEEMLLGKISEKSPGLLKVLEERKGM